MNNGLFRKGFVLGIIFLFFGAGIIPSTGTMVEKTSSIVIGSPGYIQDLIDDASDGDTIYIPSGIYYENIVINKSISLVGEDKNTTIIDGSYIGDVVNISADWVNISGFTIQKSGDGLVDAGIDIRSNNNTIIGNIITLNNENGIYLAYSDYNIIKDNTITSNEDDGIDFDDSNYNIIEHNNIALNNDDGIYIEDSEFNTIKANNVISNNGDGIYFKQSKYNNISKNNISNNSIGIYLIGYVGLFHFKEIFLGGSNQNIIIKNNLINNEQDAFFQNSRLNRWSKNYYNRPRISPKLIFGEIYWFTFVFPLGIAHYNIPWIPKIDWHPALRPYDI